jgi:ring-1,2-phenylacetyl-CoA epoxidase subunit PaaE
VNFVLSNKHKNWNLISFTCADLKINTVSAVLKEKNVKESAIKFDFYSSTQVAEIKNLGGHSKITIMVDDETTFSKSILDAAS